MESINMDGSVVLPSIFTLYILCIYAKALAVGHNARYGTALCMLSAILLFVHGTHTHVLRMALWYFAVLSYLTHSHMFIFSLYVEIFPCRKWENGNISATDVMSSTHCTSIYSLLLFVTSWCRSRCNRTTTTVILLSQ